MNRLRRFSEALVLVEKSMVRFQVSELFVGGDTDKS